MTTAAEAALGLTARTVRIHSPELDLLEFAGDEGVVFELGGRGLAGRGVALRVDPASAEPTLAAIETHDEVGLPGCGPVAMGALPFDPAAGGTLVVPRTLVGRAADGTAWMTTIGAGVPPRPATRRGRPPDRFTLAASRPHEEWCATVDAAVEAVRRGRLHKVVLAREVVVEANRPILPLDVVRRLRALYPACMLFSAEGFVGASPELLASRLGRQVRSHPLAGTIPRSGDPAVDERLGAGLLASAKDRDEHRLVVDAVARALRPHCEDLAVPESPSIVPLRNVSHLGTLISGRLAAAPPSALALALLLHPTPAVAGTPEGEALSYIAEVEGMDRGRYAGPVGWVDANGDGEWAVGIRSAQLSGRRARLFAGVGVVADSSPEAELAETQLKLQALLAAVVRP
ncbi:MAG: isochorismate synthase [Actinomycetota bacterium]|nr:isochorismate synthase [Actinomycetota bacterium]